MKVLISDPLPEDGVKLLREKGVEVTVKTGMEKEELLQEIKAYDAIIVRSATKVRKDVIDAAENLKLVVRGGVGIDNIDVEYAKTKNITVLNTPGASTVSVAELTIGMMIAVSRKIAEATISMKGGKWEKKKFKGIELNGKTLGLIGSGRIGSAVAERAKAFGMKVIAYDPYVDDKILRDSGIEPVKDLNDLLGSSDIISLHIPKTDETVNIINAETINKMKDGAILINCARGGTVDETALYNALKEGKLYGAGLDVYSSEPPEKSPLFELDNVVLTPHIGASTKEGQSRVSIEAAEKVIEFFNL